MHTANYRGYVCAYDVVEGQLVLESLRISMSAADVPAEGLTLFGRPTSAMARAQGSSQNLSFEGLSQPIGFTGGLLLGAEPVSGFYLQLGFHPGWTFGRIHELVVEDGRVTLELNHSAAAARFRGDVGTDEPPMERGMIEEWNGKTFQHDYMQWY